MSNAAWLLPLLPLLGGLAAAGTAFVPNRKARENAHVPVIGGIGAAFVVSLVLLFGAGHGQVFTYGPWIDAGDLHIPLQFRIDGLTTMMLSMVTFVATLVAIFAAGYMHGDLGYPRFFAVFGLFVFSMTGLVLSSNYALTYAFWEGVGVCSYLLVGFWHSKPAAAAAAKKAFLVNRVGDVGFAIAIFWMWSAFGHSLAYDDILNPEVLAAVPSSTKLGIALLLFWAATAKSAQIPLFVWLPDAMEGPTPVSALIHAATMVTAGVYLIARSSLLIAQAPAVQVTIAVIGGLTALLSALIALTQTDLKRVLAYSTVSQLGYMFMALGAGIGSLTQLAIVAGMFHLFTHAFFKALLFLASGSVMHAMGGVIDMRRFGGLRHRLPRTYLTFAVGGLALAGIPPLSGFFSKDEILTVLHAAAGEARAIHHSSWSTFYWGVYGISVLTAFLTAFYTGAFFLTFHGPEKLPSPDDPEAADQAVADPHAADAHDAHGHAQDHGHGGHDSHFGHESPPIMTMPLLILAGCAVLVGLLFGPTHLFEHHVLNTPGFHDLPHAEHHGTDWLTVGLGSFAALAGLGLSYVFYFTRENEMPGQLARDLQPFYLASYSKFWIDTLYTWAVIYPTWAVAHVCRFLDIYLVDGLVRLFAWFPRFVGRDILAPFQNGLVQFYALVTALGVVCLFVILMFSEPLSAYLNSWM